MKLSQSNFNLRSQDSDWVHSYLIATVLEVVCFQNVPSLSNRLKRHSTNMSQTTHEYMNICEQSTQQTVFYMLAKEKY